MADVEVGQVRRPQPKNLGHGYWNYELPPFEVTRAGSFGHWLVRYIDEKRERRLHGDNVALCPLWPSEHEQYKDARGYEVKT